MGDGIFFFFCILMDLEITELHRNGFFLMLFSIKGNKIFTVKMLMSAQFFL